MHEIINFLKNAVDRSEMPGVNGCYIIRNGSIYSRNMSIQAGVAMESAIEFNVPAPALDAALSRMKEIDSLTVDDGVVTIKAGRLKSAIRLNPDEPHMLPDMPTEWRRTPPQFAAALAAAREHIGTDGWQICVRMMENRITAFRSASGIDIAVPGLEMLSPALLIPDVVDFLVAQGGSDEYAEQDSAMCFRWEDGRWMRAQLYASAMPEANLVKIFDNAGTEIPVEITNEFREAYADAAAMTDSVVMMTPKGFMGRTGDVANNQVEYKIKGLPKDHQSYWDKRILDPVIARAVAWNPNTWPQPCYFEAPDVRGVVMGRNRW